MKEDKRHIQLRLSPELREELEVLARRHDMSISDVVRSSLYFGMPVFGTLTELRKELACRLVTALKRESRIERSS